MKKLLLIPFLLFCFSALIAQESKIPPLPVLKGYQNVEGKITKYNSFNYVTIRDKEDKNSRQSTGEYWEVSYKYDSAFRQKLKFADFMIKQIEEKGGTTFYQDTSAIHFAVPAGENNLWGKVLLTSNSVYKLRVIREQVFVNTVSMDNGQTAEFEDYVEKVELPPRVGFLPNSVITRATYSKFNHYEFTFTTKDENTYTQKLMGPYWDLKLEVQDDNGEIDKRISYVEIQESYYRAALKSGGEIVKNRARETIFSLPGEEFTTWVRVMVTMDGVYYLKVVKVFPEDKNEPQLLYSKEDRERMVRDTVK